LCIEGDVAQKTFNTALVYGDHDQITPMFYKTSFGLRSAGQAGKMQRPQEAPKTMLEISIPIIYIKTPSTAAPRHRAA